MRALILPGLDGCTDLRREFVQALQPEIEASVVGLPTDRALGYEGIAELARNNVTGNEDFLLIGESFCGPAAILLAATPPRGLCGLVLCASFARRPVPLFSPLRHLAAQLPFQAMPMNLVMHGMMGRWSTPDWRGRLQRALQCLEGDVLRRRVAAVLNVDVMSELARITCPILIIDAGSDRVLWTGDRRAIHAVQPEATRLAIAGPHMLLQAVPNDVATAIKHWLR